uniref:Uncharacterized protein n=1 Tax=viral metagenome TaxID=1070528 RepID=A0A6C0ICB7_9ZZZZ
MGTDADMVVDTRIRTRTHTRTRICTRTRIRIRIRIRTRMIRMMEEIIVQQPHRFIVPNWV